MKWGFGWTGLRNDHIHITGPSQMLCMTETCDTGPLQPADHHTALSVWIHQSWVCDSVVLQSYYWPYFQVCVHTSLCSCALQIKTVFCPVLTWSTEKDSHRLEFSYCRLLPRVAVLYFISGPVCNYHVNCLSDQMGWCEVHLSVIIFLR